jgi:hypothetical protein
MIQGLVSRRKDLNAIDYLPLKLINGKEEEVTTGSISFYPAKGSYGTLASSSPAEKRTTPAPV